MTAKVFERVSVWNNFRYDRVYNQELQIALLNEENLEWLTAENEVDALDALCDVAYVAYGGIWKLGESPTDITIQMALNIASSISDIPYFSPGFGISMLINILECEPAIDRVMLQQAIVFVCLAEMMNMGLSQEQAEQAMLIVCDSNDSKTIKKTDSATKANVDKGAFFTPPEPRLTRLLAEAEHA